MSLNEAFDTIAKAVPSVFRDTDSIITVNAPVENEIYADALLAADIFLELLPHSYDSRLFCCKKQIEYTLALLKDYLLESAESAKHPVLTVIK